MRSAPPPSRKVSWVAAAAGVPGSPSASVASSRWLLLEPEDVLLFRDNRPFSAGQDYRAEGGFPPSPAPVAGALRGALLSRTLARAGKDFTDYIAGGSSVAAVVQALGDARSLGGLHLRGPLVCRFVPGGAGAEVRLLLPRPADLLGDEAPRLVPAPGEGVRKPLPFPTEDTDGAGTRQRPSLHIARAQNTEGVRARPRAASSVDDVGAPSRSGTTAPDLPEWCEEEAVHAYLLGEAHPVPAGAPAEGSGGGERGGAHAVGPTLTEGYIGIGRRALERTADEGLLYSVQLHRPRWTPEAAVGILLHVRRTGPIPDGSGLQGACGFLPLGGEGRSAYVRMLEGPWRPGLDSDETRGAIAQRIAADGGRFRLYLATPGIFARGWLPGLLASGRWQDPSGKPSLAWQVLGGASGKPVLVGGWDLAAGAPRPLRRAVPAGAVYYGRLSNPSDAERLVAALHFTTTLQAAEVFPEDAGEASYRAQMGFGLTLVGAWTGGESEPAAPPAPSPAGKSAPTIHPKRKAAKTGKGGRRP